MTLKYILLPVSIPGRVLNVYGTWLDLYFRKMISFSMEAHHHHCHHYHHLLSIRSCAECFIYITHFLPQPYGIHSVTAFAISQARNPGTERLSKEWVRDGAGIWSKADSMLLAPVCLPSHAGAEFWLEWGWASRLVVCKIAERGGLAYWSLETIGGVDFRACFLNLSTFL